MKRRTPSWRQAAAALSALTATVAIAACGGSTAPRSTTTASVNTALQFAKCMRAHSVPDFRDSGSAASDDSLIISNTYAKQDGQLLSESAQVVQAAANKCQKYSPDSDFGPIYSAAQMAQLRAINLVYAKCMRAHGIDYPDPVTTRGPGGHGTEMGLPRNSPPLPWRSPAYESANYRCSKQSARTLSKDGLK